MIRMIERAARYGSDVLVPVFVLSVLAGLASLFLLYLTGGLGNTVLGTVFFCGGFFLTAVTLLNQYHAATRPFGRR